MPILRLYVERHGIAREMKVCSIFAQASLPEVHPAVERYCAAPSCLPVKPQPYPIERAEPTSQPGVTPQTGL